VLSEQLAGRPAQDVFEFLQRVLAGAERRRTAELLALEAASDWILAGQQEGPTYELLAEVYQLARLAEHEGVCHLLMSATAQRGPVGPELAPGDVDMSRLSLGERKYLARGHDRDRLDRLLLDPDPAVVRNLLRNPHLIERDVVRLAARRPVCAEVLQEIAASRWGGRYAVRLALVSNPYTPTEMSLKLVGFLLRKDLTMVAGDNALHRLVRAEARRFARTRRSQPEPD
jgi:hypothetical protein